MILYFSGTGNSHYAAKVLSDATKDEVKSLNVRMREKNREKLYSKKPFVIVTPTYGWRIPRAVEAFLRDVSFEGTSGVYFVMTCGKDCGNAGRYIRKFCRKKSLTYMGLVEVVMPENYIAMFDVPNEDEAAKIIIKAEPVLLAAAKKIKDGERIHERETNLLDFLKSAVANPLFRFFCVSDRKFYTEKGCNGCGTCARVCPQKNIRMKDEKPEWCGSCIHCMGCISSCPKQVIEYGERTKGKRRYYLKIR